MAKSINYSFLLCTGAWFIPLLNGLPCVYFCELSYIQVVGVDISSFGAAVCALFDDQRVCVNEVRTVVLSINVLPPYIRYQYLGYGVPAYLPVITATPCRVSPK